MPATCETSSAEFIDIVELKDEQIAIYQASETDLPEVAKLEKEHYKEGKPYELDDYKKIFQIGEIFILKNQRGELIGTTSLTFGPNSPIEINGKKLTEDEAYYSETLFTEEYRGQGLSKHTNKLREDRARQRGITDIYAKVRPTNERSIGSLVKAGVDELVEANSHLSPAEDNDPGARFILRKTIGFKIRENSFNKHEIHTQINTVTEYIKKELKQCVQLSKIENDRGCAFYLAIIPHSPQTIRH